MMRVIFELHSIFELRPALFKMEARQAEVAILGRKDSTRAQGKGKRMLNNARDSGAAHRRCVSTEIQTRVGLPMLEAHFLTYYD